MAMDSGCQSSIIAIFLQPTLANDWDHTEYCHCYLQVPADTAQALDCLPVPSATVTLWAEYQVCQELELSDDDDGSGSEVATTTQPFSNLPTLVELLDEHSDSFSTLRGYLDVAQLLGSDALSQIGPFTVLAPTNAAFVTDTVTVNAILTSLRDDPTEGLRLLGYHVIRGRFTTADILNGEVIETESGDFVTFHKDGPDVTVTNSAGNLTANVVMADLMASNGVAHGIDRVLNPGVLPGRPTIHDGCSDPNDINLLLDHGEVYLHTELGTTIGRALTVCVAGGFECVRDRIAELGYTVNCSTCFEQYAECGLGYCVVDCFANTSSARCLGCLRDSQCWPGLVDCSGVPSEVLFGLSDTRNVSLVDLLDHMQSQFSQLDLLLQEAGLRDSAALRGTGPFTILAPVNSAFDGLEAEIAALHQNPVALLQLLGHHVIPGRFMAADFSDGEQVLTLSGSYITFHVSDTDGLTVDINGGPTAWVIMPDIEGSNGVAHGIDGVLRSPVQATSSVASGTGLCASTTDQSLLAEAGQVGLFLALTAHVPGCITAGPSCLPGAMQSEGYSASCSQCFEPTVQCILANCIMACIGDTTGPACGACAVASCWPALGVCTGVASNGAGTGPVSTITTTSFDTTSANGDPAGSDSSQNDGDGSDEDSTVIALIGVVTAVVLIIIIVVVALRLPKGKQQTAAAAREPGFSNPLYDVPSGNVNRRITSAGGPSPTYQMDSESNSAYDGIEYNSDPDEEFYGRTLETSSSGAALMPQDDDGGGYMEVAASPAKRTFTFEFEESSDI